VKPGHNEPQSPVGGQAVVEGVMMRAPGATSVAVRRPDGGIAVRVRSAKRIAQTYPLLGKPTLRGVAILIETMADGLSALNFSAAHAMPESERPGEKPLTAFALAATMAVSMAFGFFMFAVLPHLLTFGLGMLTGSEDLAGGRAVAFHLVDGVVKMAIFLGFVWAVSKMKDMRRVFEYHGAEHQAVHALEAGRDLTTESLSSFPTAHARCGTAFLVTVIAVSILVFAGVFPLMPELASNRLLNQILYVGIKLPLVLPIAGLSYEIIRLSARPGLGVLGRIVSTPGVWVQRITTQPPAPDQQEIAIVALKAATAPQRLGVTPEAPEHVHLFDDLQSFLARMEPVADNEAAP
jgi:uncharacterized protein YqhQ